MLRRMCSHLNIWGIFEDKWKAYEEESCETNEQLDYSKDAPALVVEICSHQKPDTSGALLPQIRPHHTNLLVGVDFLEPILHLPPVDF